MSALAGVPELLTPEQVAETCSVSVRTVMRAIEADELRASQLARRGCWRIAPDDVVAWIELRANRPRAERGSAERATPAPIAPSAAAPSRGGRPRRRARADRQLHVPPPTR